MNMSKVIICKLLQRRTYDILSQKYSFGILFLCLVGIIISGFRFGEIAIEWSKEKHSQIFSGYVDNIMGKSYQSMLCQYMPIDVVYTWVNGTDPKLLQELAKVKMEFEQKINNSRSEVSDDTKSTQCPYSYCLESHIVIIKPPLPESIDLKQLSESNFIFTNAKKIVHSKQKDESNSGSMILMDSRESATIARNKGSFTINSKRYSTLSGFITTEWTAPHSIQLDDVIIVTGIPGQLKENDIIQKMPATAQQYVEKVLVYSEVSAAVLILPNKTALDLVMELGKNFSIGNRAQTLRAAYLLLSIPQVVVSEDVSASRFQDNEELRYSLRSLEKFVPWVRQIFIVTNGQIPSWLNLENPRITIIPHEELYLNKSHLPTFSSPSIETHVHRIPGLSKKFLYLNDDVIFGKPVWPEDFYTQAKGHKVYLSWAVPDCRDGCPSTWINDGYCDKPCNNSECEWDGDDCKDGVSGMRFSNVNQNVQLWKEESDKLYCSANCANSWLADRYCDQSCNVADCGFDAGDCGIDQYEMLYGIELSYEQQSYKLPPGVSIFFFNLTDFLMERSVISGSFEENSAIRVSAINQKFKVITGILYKNQTTTLSLGLKGLKQHLEYEFNFDVIVDTFPSKTNKQTIFDTFKKVKIRTDKPTSTTSTTKLPIIQTMKTFPDELRKPKILKIEPTLDYSKYETFNTGAVNFPPEILAELTDLELRLNQSLLTEKGYKFKKSHLIGKYFKDLQLSSQVYKDSFSTVKLRKLQSINEYQMMEIGAFPWEKKRIFYPINDLKFGDKRVRGAQRRLLDTFGNSLRHVNRLLNKEFGYEGRKVPAHIAHLVDVDIINDLQSRFPKEFEQTSANQIRSSNDMQFAFSFFYFLMSEKDNFSMAQLFDTYDTDHSGTWSDREIRTVLSQLYDLPITYDSVQKFERIVINCSKTFFKEELERVSTPKFERYLDSKLPTVTKSLVVNCSELVQLFKLKFKNKKKYLFEIVGEEEIAFKMLKTNVSHVIAQLDDIRKKPRKFICLNDDIDHARPEAEMVKSVLIDFYESFFPIPSQFELPREFRNRFLTVKNLNEWRNHRDFIKRITYVIFIIVVILISGSLFYTQIMKFFRWFKPRRKGKNSKQKLENV